MNLNMERGRLEKIFKKRLQKYSFDVGVIEDGPHKEARVGKRGLKGKDVITDFAGGPARKLGKNSYENISDVSEKFRKFLGLNYLTKPFETKSAAGIAFLKEYFRLAFGQSNQKRVENALQAIVRNPFLRGDYGHNSKLTKKIKGFDRLGIDTAQLFKAIKAKLKPVRGGSSV